MKNKHKWFRKERYKQKLERSVDKHHTYFSNVYFTTDEPDLRDLRENIHLISWAADFHGISIEEATEHYIEREKKWGNGRFIYYDRPEVPYSIRYYYKKKKRSNHQTFLKNRPPAVCVKDGNSMVKCISTMNIEKQRSFGGIWIEKN